MKVDLGVVKQLSLSHQKGLSDLSKDVVHTRKVLLNAVYEATEVNVPTSFVILPEKLPPPTSSSADEALGIQVGDLGSIDWTP